MKRREILVGHIYHDGKHGLREVLGEKPLAGTIRYRLLASKVEREFGTDGQPKSLIGQESEVTTNGFAAWAKVGYAAEDGHRVLLRLQAEKVKLSPGESAFMQSVIVEAEGGSLAAGTRVSYDHTEGRAVAGLEKKGLLHRAGGHEVEVLPLGAARITAMALVS